mmetsp:Transcript_22826/g.34591  ORF Transcript_22826/g.34591 Transcript_22826/m.34591 type:complete len:90 (-) Transcript_22826:64-333(-)
MAACAARTEARWSSKKEEGGGSLLAAAWISSGVAPPEAVGAGMFIEMSVSYLLLEVDDDDSDDTVGGVKAWLLESDSASASAVIESFMV